MDDYDEVLSDFNFENLFLKADSSLQSSYDSVEPFHSNSPPGGHWFLESSLNTFWSKTLGSDSEDKVPFSSFSTSPQNKLLDSLSIPSNNVWSSKEKYLLEKGLELFGSSWLRLSQYIGSKTSSQIKTYVLNMEQNPVHSSATAMDPTSSYIDFTELSGTEIINEMQIPASMEEVISAVSTAQPTIPSVSDRYSRRQRFSSTSSNDSGSRDSSSTLQINLNFSPKLKSKVRKKRSRMAFKKCKSNVLSSNQKRPKTREKEPNVIFIKPKEEVSQFHIKIAESNANKNFFVLPSGEEVVKIKNESSSDISDIDIDIEDVSEFEPKPKIKVEPEEFEIKNQAKEKPIKMDIGESSFNPKPLSSLQKHIKNVREKISAIYELPPPASERKLNVDGSVTGDEKTFFPEFFLKKDPILISRYLKIRNHIYNTWLANRPNYVNKTAIRAGLKGDVNLISRVHAYLEQLGYINFGCEQCHYNQQKESTLSRTDSDKSDDAFSPTRCKSDDALSPTRRMTSRARNKISYSSLLEPPTKLEVVDEGGCTIQHINSNETVISCFGSGQSEETKIPSQPNIELISCRQYSETRAVPFEVKMSVESLILVDVHAHSSHIKEVIGLLGGRYDASSSTLFISSVFACKTISSSNIHCDMCPISQSESSERIYSMGQDVVGWYHSHPSFLPNPSEQDLETQQSLQTWFCDAGLPFIGFIISPFLKAESSHASMFRCLTMEKTGGGTIAPFELSVELYCDLTVDICSVFSEQIESLLLSIKPNYSTDNLISHQCIESMGHHLRSIQPSIPDELLESILRSIKTKFCDFNQK